MRCATTILVTGLKKYASLEGASVKSDGPRPAALQKTQH